VDGESSGKGHSEGHSKGHSKGHSEHHSVMNARERGALEMPVFCLNLCPDLYSTLAGVFKIYSIRIIVKLCKRTGPILALFK